MPEVRRDDHPNPFVLIIWELQITPLSLSLKIPGTMKLRLETSRAGLTLHGTPDISNPC